MQDGRRNINATPDGYRRGALQCQIKWTVLLRILGSFVDGLARRRDVFTNTFNRVAGSGGRREQESNSCKSRLHNYLHVPSANLTDREPKRQVSGRVP